MITAFIIYTDTSSTLVYGKHVKCIIYIAMLKNMPYSSTLLCIILNRYKSLFDLWFNAVDALSTQHDVDRSQLPLSSSRRLAMQMARLALPEMLCR